MKIIKKIFTLLLIIPLISFCFVGCKNNNESPEITPTNTPTEPEWVEVYKISYKNSHDSQTNIYSTYQFSYTTTEITKEEYMTFQSSYSLGKADSYSSGNFQKSKSATIESLNIYMTTKYIYIDNPHWLGTGNEPYIKYYKQDNQRDLVLNYVSVQILGENYFKYKYKGEEKLIYTTSFEVEYFTE